MKAYTMSQEYKVYESVYSERLSMTLRSSRRGGMRTFVIRRTGGHPVMNAGRALALLLQLTESTTENPA